mmetsp:Transcript_52903/g.125911  ORF Transcript_52903/g.125911 Transcript_52903/m.125911 type:complete len:367 (-) Transcript_52903:101-1201(-)|eukprot:CAMPEP_0180146698 /NCGR_PEP_ID=MMETSP0986-20121125/18707_1 /TAXON_ID=697907 /ORGANISM="non described non described, Strain CCMP2293" /LENGTH=366 /DNA_ID=CAMNT_0022091889 /DNA_START=44 /DNA_END=1144 /DNA_ORIENTATION=-
MAAYSDQYSSMQFANTTTTTTTRTEDTVREVMMKGMGGAGQESDTLGMASGFQEEGDTLQTSTASIRHMRIEKRYDAECGFLIGEVTELEKVPRRRVVAERSAPAQVAMAAVPSPAPQLPSAPPAAPARPAMYGIGLKIADFPPHKVLKVNDLRDEANVSIKNSISKGDLLEAIDDNSVDDYTIDQLEILVFGGLDTIVNLALFNPSTNRRYVVRARRHIPITFACGFTLSEKTVPHRVLRVDELLDPANEHVSYLVEIGDIIVAVDGVDVTKTPMNPLKDVILGEIDSVVTLTFASARNGNTFSVAVKRHIPVSSWIRWDEQGGMAAANEKQMQYKPNSAPPPDALLGPGELKGFHPDDVTGEFI